MVSEAKFKVGDRVRTTNPEAPWNGVGTIVRKGTFCWIVDFDGVEGGFFGDQLVAATQPQLTIPEGRYYKTRDGRKVGPVTLALSKDEVRCGDARWWSDGRANSTMETSADLIAEWQDEPASNNNGSTGSSTAGFTVPVFDGEDATIRYEDGRFIVNPTSFMPSVAPATSGKEDDAMLEAITEDAKANIADIRLKTADIARRLDALVADKPKPLKKGDLVVLNRPAMITGIGEYMASVQTDGGNYSLPLAALRAA